MCVQAQRQYGRSSTPANGSIGRSIDEALLASLPTPSNKRTKQAFIAAPPASQTRAPNLSSGCRRVTLPQPLAAASDSGDSEEERRRRIMALQREVAEDILASSEAEREAVEAEVGEFVWVGG